MPRLLLTLATALLLALPRRDAPTYPVGRIRTDMGEILFYLYPQTPNHQASFIKLAGQHYWDSLTFNRVIKNFVAQGGCPDTPAGFKGSPYNLAPEFNDSLRHVYGAVGAGRDDNPEKLSAGCQFYIVANKNGLQAARRQLHRVRPGDQGHGRRRGDRVGAHGFDRPAAEADSAPCGRGGAECRRTVEIRVARSKNCEKKARGRAGLEVAIRSST